MSQLRVLAEAVIAAHDELESVRGGNYAEVIRLEEILAKAITAMRAFIYANESSSL